MTSISISLSSSPFVLFDLVSVCVIVHKAFRFSLFFYACLPPLSRGSFPLVVSVLLSVFFLGGGVRCVLQAASLLV
jgi:hypothetical protein